MAKITLSSKHQVTLPVDMVRSLGLNPGDKLIATLIDGSIVLLPEPENWTEYFGGIAKGAYGSTDEEIDAYVEGERFSLERLEWRKEFEELLNVDEHVSSLVKVLREGTQRLCSVDELERSTSLGSHEVEQALGKLLDHGSVRKSFVTRPGLEDGVKLYYLVRNFMKSE